VEFVVPEDGVNLGTVETCGGHADGNGEVEEEGFPVAQPVLHSALTDLVWIFQKLTTFDMSSLRQ